MLSTSTLLVAIFIFLLLDGLLLWSFKRAQDSKANNPWTESSNLQIWLLVLAVLTIGIFIASIFFARPGGVR